MNRNKQLKDIIMYLFNSYRRQTQAPNERVLAWLDKERAQVTRTVAAMQPHIRSLQARKTSVEVLRKLNQVAMNARLKLIDRNILRAKKQLAINLEKSFNKQQRSKKISVKRKTTPVKKRRPWK